MALDAPSKIYSKIDTKNTTIFCEVKSCITSENLKMLSQANINFLQPRIESFSTPMLDLVNKGAKGCQQVSFMKNCISYKIRTIWYFLIGFPGENKIVYEKYLYDI